jgi:glycosyltransferase involved in cell wall biosynthesis
MSNLSILGVSISLLFFKRSVMRCYLAMNKNFIPDFTYGHFLSPSGEAAIDIAALCNAKSFVALGEDNLFDYDKTMLHKRAHEASGFISVSSKNTQYMLQQSGISQDKILHAPNSVSTESFFPRKKSLMREKLNLSKDDFILAFVGFFEERKGLNRVMKAIENLPHNVKIIIIGEGPQQPDLSNERILFCGKVSHTQLPEYLSASDAFILPTLSEGSCNAIVEAMACGLPIISSAIPEIQDQVPDTAGILVDPNNIENITNAIFQLYHNKEMRDKMAIAAENVVKNYTISHRVSKIIQFMTSK